MALKIKVLDACLAPTLSLASLPMRYVRRYAAHRLPRSYGALREAGVFPLKNHYYEPLTDTTGLKDLDKPRALPGIDFNLPAQIELLERFESPEGAGDGPGGFDQNETFWAGDAELWYHVIRHFKPKRIIEIGSGYSTRMAVRAIARNGEPCEHVCIEPYEFPQLEAQGIPVVRQRVEDVDLSMFDRLEENDILFIDSSHIIRPQGDVLLEFLQILPRLKKGVIVHIHDIFSPRDYPKSWLVDQPFFWNEQYLLEAFLTHNAAWEVLLAGNLLKHEAFDLLKSKCLWLNDDSEPGSFYIRRR